MTSGGLDAWTYQRGLSVWLGRQSRPDQATAPVVDHLPARISRQPLAQRAAGGGRTDDAPYRPGAERATGRERHDISNRVPDRRRPGTFNNLRVPERRKQLGERGSAMGDR